MTNITLATYDRLQQLDELLRGGRLSKKELAEELWVSEKTVQRDLAYLRDRVGAPLEYNRENNFYRYTDRNWRLPLFNLGENELLAFLMISTVIKEGKLPGHSKKTKLVIEELAQSVCEPLYIDPNTLLKQFSLNRPPVRSVDTEVWGNLISGLFQRRTVEIKYRTSRNNRLLKRVIDPYHIMNSRGEWYVLAYCHTKEEILTFSVAGIDQIKITRKHFTLPSDSTLEQRIKDGFGGFIASKGATQYEFVFHFDQKVSHRVSEMKWHHSQQERLLDDGRIEIRFNTSGLEGVLRWILAWGDQVTVMAPDELKDRIRQELAGMLRRY